MSSHRQYAGREWAGREYLPSLFIGVGSASSTVPGLTGTWLAYAPRIFPLVRGADEWYCIGFSDHPAVRAGETLANPTCASTLTISSGPVVLTSAFIGRNLAGKLIAIPAGQGVKVRLTGAVGLYDVALLVQASGGETIGTKFQVSCE